MVGTTVFKPDQFKSESQEADADAPKWTTEEVFIGRPRQEGESDFDRLAFLEDHKRKNEFSKSNEMAGTLGWLESDAGKAVQEELNQLEQSKDPEVIAHIEAKKKRAKEALDAARARFQGFKQAQERRDAEKPMVAEVLNEIENMPATPHSAKPEQTVDSGPLAGMGSPRWQAIPEAQPKPAEQSKPEASKKSWWKRITGQ